VEIKIDKYGVRSKILRHQQKRKIDSVHDQANINRDVLASFFATTPELAPVAKRYKASTQPDANDLGNKMKTKKDVGQITIYMRSKIGNGYKYTCKLPGETEITERSAATLKPWAAQLQIWNDTHPKTSHFYQPEEKKKIVIEDSDDEDPDTFINSEADTS